VCTVCATCNVISPVKLLLLVLVLLLRNFHVGNTNVIGTGYKIPSQVAMLPHRSALYVDPVPVAQRCL
jgi:heterodisulfide reductase subunit C